MERQSSKTLIRLLLIECSVRLYESTERCHFDVGVGLGHNLKFYVSFYVICNALSGELSCTRTTLLEFAIKICLSSAKMPIHNFRQVFPDINFRYVSPNINKHLIRPLPTSFNNVNYRELPLPASLKIVNHRDMPSPTPVNIVHHHASSLLSLLTSFNIANHCELQLLTSFNIIDYCELLLPTSFNIVNHCELPLPTSFNTVNHRELPLPSSLKLATAVHNDSRCLTEFIDLPISGNRSQVSKHSESWYMRNTPRKYACFGQGLVRAVWTEVAHFGPPSTVKVVKA